MKRFLKISLTFCVITSFFFVGCKNFMNGSGVMQELNSAIDYANAEKFTVLINSTDGSGSFLTGNGEKKLKVGDSVEVEFKVNDAWQFQKWIAVDKDNQSKNLTNYIKFSNSTSTKTTVTLLAECENILVMPKCVERLKVESNSPKMEDRGIPYNTSIIIQFNRYIDSNSFYFTEEEILELGSDVEKLESKDILGNTVIYGYKQDGITYYKNISITSSSEEFLNEYYNPPVIVSGKTVLLEKNGKPFYFDVSNTKIIKVSLTPYIKDTNGVSMQETIFSYNYKVNTSKRYNSNPQKIVFLNKLDEGNIKPESSKECYVGESYEILYETKNNHKFSYWQAIYNDGSNDKADDIITFADKESATTTFTLNYDIPNIAIKPICTELMSVTSVFPINLSKENIRNTDIRITFSEPLSSDCEKYFDLKDKENCCISILSNQNEDLSSCFKNPELSVDRKTIYIGCNIDKPVESYTQVIVTIDSTKIKNEDDIPFSENGQNEYSFSFTVGTNIQNTAPVITSLLIGPNEKDVRNKDFAKCFELPDEDSLIPNFKNYCGYTFFGSIKASDNTAAKYLYVEEKRVKDIYGTILNEEPKIKKIELPKAINGVNSMNFSYTFSEKGNDGLFEVSFYVEDDYSETTKKQSEKITYYLIKDTVYDIGIPVVSNGEGTFVQKGDPSLSGMLEQDLIGFFETYYGGEGYNQDDYLNKYNFTTLAGIKLAATNFIIKNIKNDVWWKEDGNVQETKHYDMNLRVFYGNSKENCVYELPCTYNSSEGYYTFSTLAEVIDSIPYSVFEVAEGFTTTKDNYIKIQITDSLGNTDSYFRIVPASVASLSYSTKSVNDYYYKVTINSDFVSNGNNLKCRTLVNSIFEKDNMTINGVSPVLYYTTRKATNGINSGVPYLNYMNNPCFEFYFFFRTGKYGSNDHNDYYSLYFQTVSSDSNVPSDENSNIFGGIAVTSRLTKNQNNTNKQPQVTLSKEKQNNGDYLVKATVGNFSDENTNTIIWEINGSKEIVNVEDVSKTEYTKTISNDRKYDIKVTVHSVNKYGNRRSASDSISVDEDKAPPFISSENSVFAGFEIKDDILQYKILLPLEDSHGHLYSEEAGNLNQKFYLGSKKNLSKTEYEKCDFIQAAGENSDNETAYYYYPVSDLRTDKTYYLYGSIKDTENNEYSGCFNVKLGITPFEINFDVSNNQLTYTIPDNSTCKNKLISVLKYDSDNCKWIESQKLENDSLSGNLSLDENENAFYKVTGYATDMINNYVIPTQYFYSSSVTNEVQLKTFYIANDSVTLFRTNEATCPSIVNIYTSKYDYGDNLDLWKISSKEITMGVITDSASYKPTKNEVPSGNYYIIVATFADGTEIASDVLQQK